jgi:hypothetical protein
MVSAWLVRLELAMDDGRSDLWQVGDLLEDRALTGPKSALTRQ